MAWKTAFSIAAFLLVISNIFWIYAIQERVLLEPAGDKQTYELRQGLNSALALMPKIGRAMTRTTLTSIGRDAYPDDFYADANTVYIGWLKFNLEGGRIGSVQGLSADEKVAIEQKARALD